MSVQFNKNGNLICAYIMEYKVLDDGSVWKLLNYLDVTHDKTWFASDAEVANCTDKSNRYSIMGKADLYKNSDGEYEFLLMYPSLSKTLYNRWKQTSPPSSSTVTGFTEITTAWSAHNCGIRKHATSAVYDCDSGGTWYAAIGQKKAWTSTNYIPAANSSSQTSTELWVRVDTLPVASKTKLYSDYIESIDFIEI